MSAARVGRACINLWASPRSGSTSVMYSFAQRTATKAVDEPLYAHYLSAINPSCERPYRDLVLEAQNKDGNAVVSSFLDQTKDDSTLFNKHMSKHFANLNNDSKEALLSMSNVILIRDPREVFQSFDHSKGIGESKATLYDTGIYNQKEIITTLQNAGQKAIVVDYSDMVSQPDDTIRALCDALDIPFEASMLSWDTGPKDIDGVWAPWWYTNTHKSSGFKAGIGRSAKDIGNPEGFAPVKDEAMALYNEIIKHKISPSSK